MILAMLAIAGGITAAAQNYNGTWIGTIEAGGEKLLLVFHLDEGGMFAGSAGSRCNDSGGSKH